MPAKSVVPIPVLVGGHFLILAGLADNLGGRIAQVIDHHGGANGHGLVDGLGGRFRGVDAAVTAVGQVDVPAIACLLYTSRCV